MLVGILATPVFSAFLKKTRKYKIITAISNFYLINADILGCYVFFGLLIYVYAEGIDNFATIAVCAGLAGFFLIPNVSLYIAYSAETAFPIGEGSAGGYLFAAGQTFGFLLGITIISVLNSKRNPALISFLVFEVLIVLSLVLIAWTKEDLKRQKYEENLRRSSVNGEI